MMKSKESHTLLNRKGSRVCCIRCYRFCCVGCVCSKGILLLLTWSVLIHSFGYYMLFQLLASYGYTFGMTYYFIAVSGIEAVVFLLYPVAGLLGEVCFSRYKLMIVGTILALIGIVITVPTVILGIFTVYCENRRCSFRYFLFFPICVFGLVLYQFGRGLFESNAIQFGTDQLQFASNDKLSVFINWYFWTLYFITMLVPVIFFGLAVWVVRHLFQFL